MTYERIDVSMVYVHLIWSYMFCIYIIMASMGLYAIWTDLREQGADKESWLTFILFLSWVVLAVIVYQVTEGV